MVFVARRICRVFSVSKCCEKEVLEYIRNQKEHHRRKDFKEEFLELLIQNEIEYDLRYVLIEYRTFGAFPFYSPIPA
jgi:hypothetical protein